jgi:CHAT domain-containing protein
MSLGVGNITYLANYKQTNPNSYYNVKSLQDISIKFSKMSLTELNNNKISEDTIVELQKKINFQTTKLLQQSNITPFDVSIYNLDSIRKYLKEDDCYVFHYTETDHEDSIKRWKDFIGYLYGFNFNLANDGIIIESTSEKSPASFILKPTDRIIQVNNKTISNVKEMTDEVYSSSSMNIKIIRENDTLKYKLKRDSVFKTYIYVNDVFVIVDKDNPKPKVISYLINKDRDKYIWETLFQNYSKGLQEVKDERTYEIIFKPLFDEIKKFKTVYYSLSGDFNNFNIEQVFDTDTKKYLSEEFDFHSCPTLEDYYQIKKSEDVKASNNKIVIFGNPDFSKFSDALSANTNRSAWEDLSYYYSDSISKVSFSNLPYTKYEIDEINKIGKSNGFMSFVYEGKLCSETSIKNLSSPFILHIATHGYYFNNSNNTFVNKYSSISNSLLNTGLILTEAKTKTNEINDGFLSAYEVLDLNLKNTELVVLSACETSLASYNYTGSDVNSLQKSFRMAGAKAVLASKFQTNKQEN